MRGLQTEFRTPCAVCSAADTSHSTQQVATVTTTNSVTSLTSRRPSSGVPSMTTGPHALLCAHVLITEPPYDTG